MKQVTTFVRIDAHKKDLVVAMLSGPAAAITPCRTATCRKSVALPCGSRTHRSLPPAGMITIGPGAARRIAGAVGTVGCDRPRVCGTTEVDDP